MKFNVNEIFEIAIQIERNGAFFYKRCADAAQDGPVKELLATLGEVEVKHEHIFTEMLRIIKNDVDIPNRFDPDNEAAHYLQAMADGHVFDLKNDPASQLTGKESVETILRAALGREKDSIVYYLGLKELVPDDLGKDKVDKIIKEEMSHVVFISNAIKELYA